MTYFSKWFSEMPLRMYELSKGMSLLKKKTYKQEKNNKQHIWKFVAAR